MTSRFKTFHNIDIPIAKEAILRDSHWNDRLEAGGMAELTSFGDKQWTSLEEIRKRPNSELSAYDDLMLNGFNGVYPEGQDKNDFQLILMSWQGGINVARGIRVALDKGVEVSSPSLALVFEEIDKNYEAITKRNATLAGMAKKVCELEADFATYTDLGTGLTIATQIRQINEELDI